MAAPFHWKRKTPRGNHGVTDNASVLAESLVSAWRNHDGRGPLAYTILRCHSVDACNLTYVVKLARYQIMIVVEGEVVEKKLLRVDQGNLGSHTKG